jgi:hypothetical protein
MGVEIRSYRRVFDLERRIYRIDRLRLNPGGIPIRSLLYLIAAVMVTIGARRLPLLGLLEHLAPWYVSDLALPALLATVLSAIRIEGRPFHVAARSLGRHACRPRRLERATATIRPGWRWRPADLLVLPDGSDARMRRLRYTGPGVARIAPAHERRYLPRRNVEHLTRRPELIIVQMSGRSAPASARLIELAPGVRMLVR